MRELTKEERIKAMQERYDIGEDNLFDVNAIVELEDEYNRLTNYNPEHTTRRRELLRMRDELKKRLYGKPKPINESIDKCKITHKDDGSSVLNEGGFTKKDK